MARLRFNGVANTLAAVLGDDSENDTTITFSSKLTGLDGDVPTIAAPDYLVLRVDDEIVYLTAYTSGETTGTVSRGEEGTTVAEHQADAEVRHVPTADDFQFEVVAGAGIDVDDSDPTAPTVALDETTQTTLATAVLSDDVRHVVAITQEDYDLLDPPDADTLYAIVEVSP